MNTLFPEGLDTDSDDPCEQVIGIKYIWDSKEVSKFSRQTMIAGFSVWFLLDFSGFFTRIILYYEVDNFILQFLLLLVFVVKLGEKGSVMRA